MTFKRWLPTFLAFPLGGFLAIATVGSLDGPLLGRGRRAARRRRDRRRPVAGAALARDRPALDRATPPARWRRARAVAAVVTGAGTELADVMLAGLITGAAVGAAQSTLLPRRRASAAWTAVTAGELVARLARHLAVVGVDIERGFVVFGSSGALVATVLTGLALRSLQGRAAGA